jgi:gamma-glutamyltranspeptidase/glutathione hydrolase
MNPQQALDAPRWQWMFGDMIAEDGFCPEIARQLAARGHKVNIELQNTLFGRGQMIIRLPNGTLVGGTESRTDSNIACY